MNIDFTKPTEVAQAYCFDDSDLSYPAQQVRRFVAELGAVALFSLLTSCPSRQAWGDLSDFDYCLKVTTSNIYTDQVDLLTEHMVEWFLWLKELEVFQRFDVSPHFKAHELKRDITSRLNQPRNISFGMAHELLSRGFPARRVLEGSPPRTRQHECRGSGAFVCFKRI